MSGRSLNTTALDPALGLISRGLGEQARLQPTLVDVATARQPAWSLDLYGDGFVKIVPNTY